MSDEKAHRGAMYQDMLLNAKRWSEDEETPRWCSFCGDAWHGTFPCHCHESYMEDFPDKPAVIAAWLLGGREAIHAMERDLINGLADRGQLPAGRPESPYILGARKGHG